MDPNINAQNGTGSNVGQLVQTMQSSAQNMMQFQFQIGQSTAMLQAESTSINQMTRALNTAVQNIRA